MWGVKYSKLNRGVSGGWSKVGAELQSGVRLQRQKGGTRTSPSVGQLDKGQVQMGRHNGRVMIQVGQSRVRFAEAAVTVQFSDAHTEWSDGGLVGCHYRARCLRFYGVQMAELPLSLGLVCVCV